jgi:hypothetical protein
MAHLLMAHLLMAHLLMAHLMAHLMVHALVTLNLFILFLILEKVCLCMDVHYFNSLLGLK